MIPPGEESSRKVDAPWTFLARAPKDWSDNYPEATFQVINRQNYLSFIVP